MIPFWFGRPQDHPFAPFHTGKLSKDGAFPQKQLHGACQRNFYSQKQAPPAGRDAVVTGFGFFRNAII